MNRPIPLPSLALILTTVATVSSATPGNAQEKIVTAKEIQLQVIEAPPTRSFISPVRKGFQFESSRSVIVEDRGLVEVEITVDSEANISIPIRFKLDCSDDLADTGAERQLRELAEALKTAPSSDHYLIEGHTCVKGETDHNNRLSIARANYIVEQLEQAGVKAKLTPIGCGEAEAMADGLDSSSGEARLAPFRKVILHKVAE